MGKFQRCSLISLVIIVIVVIIIFIPWLNTVKVMEPIIVRLRAHTWICLSLNPIFFLPLSFTSSSLVVVSSNLSNVISSKFWPPKILGPSVLSIYKGHRESGSAQDLAEWTILMRINVCSC